MKNLAIILMLLLSSCGLTKKQATCDSEDASSLYANMMNKEIVKLMSSKNEFGGFAVDESQARSLTGLLKYQLEQVRTAMSDPNSTKKTCDAKIKIILPNELLETSESTRQNLYDASQNGAGVTLQADYTLPIRQQLGKRGFEVDANALSKNTTFDVQPTDDGKSLVMNSSDITDKARSIAMILVLNPLESKAKEIKGDIEVQKAQEEQNALNLAKQNYLLAKESNTTTRNQINERWKLLPDYVRAQILQEQKAWVAQKKVNCGEPNGKNAPQPQTETEFISAKEALECDTRMTQDRLDYLSR